MFSDLLKDAEAAVGKLIPRDGPHDTREVEALKLVADDLDPSLAPLFDAIARAGDAVEAEFHNLAGHVRTLRAALVAKQKAPAPAAPPQTAYPTESVAETPTDEAPAPVADTPDPTVPDAEAASSSAEATTEASAPEPAPVAAAPAPADTTPGDLPDDTSVLNMGTPGASPDAPLAPLT